MTGVYHFGVEQDGRVTYCKPTDFPGPVTLTTPFRYLPKDEKSWPITCDKCGAVMGSHNQGKHFKWESAICGACNLLEERTK